MSTDLKTQTTASPVAAFSRLLDRMKPQMAMALPKHMSADRMARLALTAFSTSRDLQICKPDSILASLMTATQLGLEPGINGQGYLIAYKGICTFVPGWKGLVDLVARAGRATVWTGAVYPGDKFDYQLGDEPFCRHKPEDGDGEFSHVYAIGRVRDAQMPVIEVWTRGKVQKHLTQYNKVGGKHYAMANENNFEMYARKVALLQVLKYMPSSIELANALAVSHAAESGQHAVIEGDFVTVSSGAADLDAGEVKTPERAAPKPWPADKFATQFSIWKDAVTKGGSTVDQVVAHARGIGSLSEAQELCIRDLRPATTTPAQDFPADPDDDGWGAFTNNQ
jgi:recombination protein RecT